MAKAKSKSSSKTYLAVDLGASGGRVLAGLFDGRRLTLEEVHRFPNGGVSAGDSLYWDVLQLWSQIKQGLRMAADRYPQITSVGLDTWGVDFALLDGQDKLLSNPFHYRDKRTEGILERAFQMVSREQIFAATGLQFMPFNSLFQLLAMKLERSPLLDAADCFLMMPDLFNWLLTGQKVNEYTDATTSQMLDPRTGQWAQSLLESFDLPSGILQRIAQPGTSLGRLRDSVAQETRLGKAEVVLPGTHDTASAVMAVPASGEASDQPPWCYISSGTWSLMGAEVSSPVINDTCRQLNFTNEGGVGGTIRLLKNIAGLWLVQECRRIWSLEGQDHDWQQLTELAQASPPLQGLIDPDASEFMAPEHMPEAIQAFCKNHGQPVPETPGAVIRCALESLALRYRQVLMWLEQLTDGHVHTIHIVGGGTQNTLLCQMAADACNRQVIAGPVEATAIGNLLMQAVAAGDIETIAGARLVIQDSFQVQAYEPQNTDRWNEAFERFQQITRPVA